MTPYWHNEQHGLTIYLGDCLDVLAALPERLAQTCVTSPPYWGLRSYLDADDPNKPLELGTERTPEEYVARMVEVFREVRRVLRDDGTCWLNLGSSYVSQRIESEEMVLRDDLTPEERAYVLRELAKHEEE